MDISVPQGSILGSLLFILYVNDLPDISNKVSFIQFADDTSIFISGKSLSGISNTMNKELCQVFEWMKNNRLTFNIDKTLYMVTCSKGKKYDTAHCKININGCAVDQVYNTKFLGVYIDEHLTWTLNISHRKYLNVLEY